VLGDFVLELSKEESRGTVPSFIVERACDSRWFATTTTTTISRDFVLGHLVNYNCRNTDSPNMPPMPSRMIKNRVKDFRYRPGKAEVEDEEDEFDSEEEEDDAAEAQKPSAPAPKASTFPSQKKLAIDLSKADQQKSSVPEASTNKQPDDADLEGFETASESEDEAGGVAEGSSEEEEESSEEEDSSSGDEPKRPMLAPKFISKAQRNKTQTAQPTKTAEEIAAEDERRRKEKADEMLQAQMERDQAARAAGKKAWDDEDNIEEEVDDTDGLDEEAERAAWKLRELKRVRRDRLAIEEKEKEREEVDRRRALTDEERKAEDEAFIAAQKDDQEGKGKMAYMQKYFHKGAFFQGDEEQDEEVKAALNRDLAGARFEDETSSKEVLPEYMRIRDMSKLGKKGRTKYQDLKSEDTGRWGTYDGKKKGYDGLDDRFRPDDPRDGNDRTGANAAPVGERRRRDDDGQGDRDGKRVKYD
jgi:microfibrillar-associated protein 1